MGRFGNCGDMHHAAVAAEEIMDETGRGHVRAVEIAERLNWTREEGDTGDAAIPDRQRATTAMLAAADHQLLGDPV